VANHDIVVIGASAGGVGVLKDLVESLPPDLPASIFVVMHLKSEGPSALADILNRNPDLPAAFAEDNEPIERGRIYVAPPNRHLLLIDGRLKLGTGAWENNARPAIDPLFRSAAACCGSRTIAVILTGLLSDGSSGLHAVKRCGGLTVVQDPMDAENPDMPRNAIAATDVDHIVPMAQMADLISRLVALPAAKPRPVPRDISLEVAIAAGGETHMSTPESLGERSLVTCPDCHGLLWEIEDGALVRYRCHVGHAYSADALNEALSTELGRALGAALRVLEERTHLLQKLAHQAERSKQVRVAKLWREKAKTYSEQAETVRRAILEFDSRPITADLAASK
jgi:two-component system chemotaxis response regulator CheB